MRNGNLQVVVDQKQQSTATTQQSTILIKSNLNKAMSDLTMDDIPIINVAPPSPTATTPTIPNAVPVTPVAAHASAGVRTRQELLVKKGIYKGKRGWVDESRGKKGYSPSGKSVYIIYLDDGGNEKAAGNYIRTASISFTQWSHAENTNNPVLLNNPALAMHLSELCTMLRQVEFENDNQAAACRNGFVQLFQQILTR